MNADLPTYRDLMLPVVRAIHGQGGSGTAREITDVVVESQGFSEDVLAVTYEGRDKSILLDRIDWARSYCKLGGVLESPKRGLFLITDLGREIAELPDSQADERLLQIDRGVRRARRTKKKEPTVSSDGEELDTAPEDDEAWRETLLSRLHGLSPDAFERFVMYLLRSHGMELRRVGGSGDEGIDGIGTAPIGNVLTTTIAVQAKRYEPARTVGRDAVALFQSDATAAGAEHGILVTTARFSKPAREAALNRHPTIDLVDGERLTELCLDAGAGVSLTPVVTSGFFDRFEDV